MSALFVTLDILQISKLGLNINTYLTLLKYQHDMEGRSFPFVPDENSNLILLEKGMIKWNVEKNGYELSKDGIRIFEDDDLFEEFYATFPHKVPTGIGYRPVSTQDAKSMSAQTTRAIWNRVVKNKPYLQRIIIDSLKRELAHRTAEGNLIYLHNIDTWLRQATWEKWQDIPDKKSSGNYIKL